MHPDSSRVQLPVLPDAKMDTRNEIRGSPVQRCNLQSAARDDGKLRGAGQYEVLKMQPSATIREVRSLNRELVASEVEAVEVADDGRGDAVGLEEFAGQLLDIFDGDALKQSD